MTQTETTFAAATSRVTPGDSRGNQVIIDLLDDMPSRLATAVMLRGAAEELMRSLAKQLGYTVVEVEAPSDDPYCAQHGRRFDPAVGCPDCLVTTAAYVCEICGQDGETCAHSLKVSD